MEIHAKDNPIKKLFGGDFLYEIPDFQRPFSWKKDNFEDLIDDIFNAYERNKEDHGDIINNIDKYNPYFLGSIILQKSNKLYKIIDGQQRLTSISILLAVLRDLIQNQDSIQDQNTEGLQVYIIQKAKEYELKQSSPRIKVREKEESFYENYILTYRKTDEIKDEIKKNLTAPQKRIYECVKTFRNYLKERDKEELKHFASYIIEKVVMVNIETDSLSSAFRLFSITNARGMPLTNADLLKSENLGFIEDEKDRHKYTKKWEEIEEKLGYEELEKLISFIRHLKLRKKARESIYEEYKDKIFSREPNFKGKSFINYLERVFDIYKKKILDGFIKTKEVRKEVHYYNLIAILRSFFPTEEWKLAIIRFVDVYQDNFDVDLLLDDFLTKLERKIAIDWFTGLSRTKRLYEVYKILAKIENNKKNPKKVINASLFNADLLNKRNKERFRDTLNLDNFYRKGNYSMAKYTLLRIDLERYDNTNRKTSYEGNITVEHILPQKATADYWIKRFNDSFRQEWTDKMGNLTLLNRNKNYGASNKPYKEKVEKYLTSKNDFGITNELTDNYNDWNPDNLKQRHRNLVEETLNIWF